MSTVVAASTADASKRRIKLASDSSPIFPQKLDKTIHADLGTDGPDSVYRRDGAASLYEDFLDFLVRLAAGFGGLSWSSVVVITLRSC